MFTLVHRGTWSIDRGTWSCLIQLYRANISLELPRYSTLCRADSRAWLQYQLHLEPVLISTPELKMPCKIFNFC